MSVKGGGEAREAVCVLASVLGARSMPTCLREADSLLSCQLPATLILAGRWRRHRPNKVPGDRTVGKHCGGVA